MSKIKKLLYKILRGNSDKNIAFQDIVRLLLYFNFTERIKGSHYIYTKKEIEEILNIQPLKDSKAKAYQVKQIREIILKYKLMDKLEEDFDVFDKDK